MGNCLVKEFKAVVNNDSLKKFGCIIFKADTVTSTKNTIIRYVGDVRNVAKVRVYAPNGSLLNDIVGGTTTDGGITYTYFNCYEGTYFGTYDQVTIELSKKYELAYINGSSLTVDLSDTDYCNKMVFLSLSNSSISGTLAENTVQNLKTVAIENSLLSEQLDINIFGNSPLTSIDITAISANITGDINVAFTAENITHLDIHACPSLIGNVSTLNFISNPYINIKGTGCTVTQSFIDTITAAGGTILYDSNQVVS